MTYTPEQLDAMAEQFRDGAIEPSYDTILSALRQAAAQARVIADLQAWLNGNTYTGSHYRPLGAEHAFSAALSELARLLTTHGLAPTTEER